VPTVEDTQHSDLMQRLDAIERKIEGITARL
jgi:tetrahydromethanopterin S-methyltransferase subunit G